MPKGQEGIERSRIGVWWHDTFDDWAFRSMIGPAQVGKAVHGADKEAREQWKRDLEARKAAGRQADAVTQAAQVLSQDPQNAVARRLMAAAIAGSDRQADASGVDWSAMEDELADVVPPRFVRSGDRPEPVAGSADRVFDVESSSVRLADVGGMDAVKRRLELAFLGPLRNPRLRTLFGKSLRGGLLLYGPPGCGKTFLARAVAGEIGARFLSLSVVDVLDMWMGTSERNLHNVFEAARSHAPCVLFLDELDALGHKRSQLNSSAMRTLGNQLLACVRVALMRAVATPQGLILYGPLWAAIVRWDRVATVVAGDNTGLIPLRSPVLLLTDATSVLRP